MLRMRRFLLAPARITALAVLAGLLLSVCVSNAVTIQRDAGAGSLGNPRVLPPASMPYGHSYGEWSVTWWQWAYGLPVAGHPLFDETGTECYGGQAGPVWFLGGVFNVSGSAVRTDCVMPAGKAVFFPIINVEWDNLCPPTDPPLSIDELRATADWFMDLATGLSCEVDGLPMEVTPAYRVQGDPFSIQLPAGSIWEFFGCPLAPGIYGPLVPDGYFLMLAPLAVGDHVIHFRGTIADPVNFTLDITYELKVLSARQWLMSGLPAEALEGTAPAPVTSSWGRVKAIYR